MTHLDIFRYFYIVFSSLAAEWTNRWKQSQTGFWQMFLQTTSEIRRQSRGSAEFETHGFLADSVDSATIGWIENPQQRNTWTSRTDLLTRYLTWKYLIICTYLFIYQHLSSSTNRFLITVINLSIFLSISIVRLFVCSSPCIRFASIVKSNEPNAF